MKALLLPYLFFEKGGVCGKTWLLSNNITIINLEESNFYEDNFVMKQYNSKNFK